MTRVLVPLLAVAFLVGCDTTETAKRQPPKTVSHGRFIYLANRACRVAIHEMNAIKVPPAGQTLDPAARAFEKAYERLLATLHGLAPPPSQADTYRRMLDTATAQKLAFAKLFDAFAVAGRHVRAENALGRRADKLGAKANRLSERLGLTVCAKPW